MCLTVFASKRIKFCGDQPSRSSSSDKSASSISAASIVLIVRFPYSDWPDLFVLSFLISKKVTKRKPVSVHEHNRGNGLIGVTLILSIVFKVKIHLFDWSKRVII